MFMVFLLLCFLAAFSPVSSDDLCVSAYTPIIRNIVVGIGGIFGLFVIQILSAKRTDHGGRRVVIGHVPFPAGVVGAAAAARFHRGRAAVLHPVTVRAAADGLQLVQGELLVPPVGAELVPDLLRHRRVHAGVIQQRRGFLGALCFEELRFQFVCHVLHLNTPFSIHYYNYLNFHIYKPNLSAT